MSKAALRTSRVRGLETAWLDSGVEKGPILIMLHGFPDGPQVWDDLAASMGNQCRVICPFVRGAGESEVAEKTSRYGVNSLSLDVLEILKIVDPTGERPVICCGHDLGSVIAWSLSSVLGDRLKGLVIFNGLSLTQLAARFGNPRQWLKSWYIFLMQIPRLPDMVLSRFGLPMLTLAYSLGNLPTERRQYPDVTRHYLVAPMRQYRAFARDLPKQLVRRGPKLHCPLLVVWGNGDRFLETPNLSEFSPDANDVQLRILEGGHWVFREKPEAVAGILRDFVEGTGVHAWNQS